MKITAVISLTALDYSIIIHIQLAAAIVIAAICSCVCFILSQCAANNLSVSGQG